MDYLWLKLIHILSATILFGTGIGSAFYMFMANRRKDIAGIYFATRHVVIADWLFTTPSVIIQFITGVALAHRLGLPLTDGWVFWALILYLFAGACWLPVVWMQIKMRDIAKASLETGAPLTDRYWKLDHWWTILGSMAFPAVVVIIGLMVIKP
ncbi:DUF2269 family protein [bacterium]|nr:DUF2269 family protein [bacterium]